MLGGCATFLLVVLFSLDVFTDIATGVELILNDHVQYGLLVLLLVLTPGFIAILAEIYKCCLYEGFCGRNATDWLYLLVYPLFTVIMMGLGTCHVTCHREGMYLRSLQGFITAAGQIILNLYVLSRGVLIHSLAQTVHYLTTQDPEQRAEFKGAEHPLRWYWGLIQMYSLVFSAVSLLQTVVYFNECEKKTSSIWRLFVAVPFYGSTIVYRVLAISLLLLFYRQYTLIPVMLILTFNIISFKILGLDLPRSVVYGFASILAPAGFNRCRNPKLQPLGYVSDEVRYSERSPEQLENLKERSKRFLALHLIFGAFVLGVSLVLLWIMLNFSQLYSPLIEYTILPKVFVNDYILPTILLAFVCSTVFTVLYCCTILCCFEDEYVYPLTIH